MATGQTTEQARRLLRAEEAGQQLALGRATIYKLIASGALRSVKIGASRRVPADALDEFVASLRAADPGSPPEAPAAPLLSTPRPRRSPKSSADSSTPVARSA